MKKGFTLAEVLITLTIVGTIAVLTIPQVMQDYKYKLYTTQLKKVYSEISNGIELAKNTENTDDFFETASFNATSDAHHGAQYFLTNYIKNINDYSCGASNTRCITAKIRGAEEPDVKLNYESLDGTQIENDDGKTGLYGQHCAQTKTGATICAGFTGENTDARLIFTVDVNGINAPNTSGRDVFALFVTPDGLIVDAEDVDKCGEESDYFDGTAAKYSLGCLKSIMDNDWQMEY